MIDCHVTRHVSSLLGLTGDQIAEMLVAERTGSDIDNRFEPAAIRAVAAIAVSMCAVSRISDTAHQRADK
eukprot:595-Heterococcus_DN1.PRE.1